MRLPGGLRTLDHIIQSFQPLVTAGRGWLKLLAALVDAGAVTKSTVIDSTDIKIQRAAFGAKGGARYKQSGVRAVAGPRKSMRLPTSSDAPMR